MNFFKNVKVAISEWGLPYRRSNHRFQTGVKIREIGTIHQIWDVVIVPISQINCEFSTSLPLLIGFFMNDQICGFRVGGGPSVSTFKSPFLNRCIKSKKRFNSRVLKSIYNLDMK